LSPAGRSLPLGDLPLNMALAHDKKMLAVTNNGHDKQVVQLIDPKNERLLDEVTIAKSWYGIRFSEDDKKLYVSGGNDNIILAYPISNRKIGKADTIILGKKWPNEKIAQLELMSTIREFALHGYQEDSSLFVVDLQTKRVVNKIQLGYEAYACILSPDKKQLYISLWGGDKVAVFNTATMKMETEIATESHPNEILLTKNGKYLFVANANDNSVSVINTATRKVIETISATLFPTKLTGSTTNGLALSPDERTLYIANADNNCLAVFDVTVPGSSTSKGFIPTGWYPTNVKTVANKLFVSNGKGFASMANPRGPQPVKKTDNSGSHIGITKAQEFNTSVDYLKEHFL
jgi:YVTN family beta-propeller protein